MNSVDRRGFIGGSMAATAAIAALNAEASAGLAPSIASPRRPVLIRGADLLTMDTRLGEMSGADVLIDRGKIMAVGKGLRAEGAEIVDAAGMILMPGMCDGHRHLWLTAEAGRLVKTAPSSSGPPREAGATAGSVYERYIGYQDWKFRTMVALTPEDHYLAALIGGLQAIDSGVTSVLDFSNVHYTPEIALAGALGARDSGVAGWSAYQLGINADYKTGEKISRAAAAKRHMAPAEEKHWAIAAMLRDKVFSDADAPMQLALAPSMFNDFAMGPVQREFARARDMGVGLIASHVVKPAKPSAPGRYGARGAGIYDLKEAGLLGPDFHIAHGNGIDDEEFRMLHDTGGMLAATVLVEFNYAADWRGAPVHARARKAGVAAGIGMDMPMSVTHDYFEHVRSAFWSLYLDRPGQEIASDANSEYVLGFATGPAAAGLRLGEVTGSITVGKRADLVLLRTDRIGFAMQGSLADRVVNFAALQDVDSVWVMGVPRKRHGRMLGVNWADLKNRLAAAQRRFRAQADTVTIIA